MVREIKRLCEEVGAAWDSLNSGNEVLYTFLSSPPCFSSGKLLFLHLIDECERSDGNGITFTDISTFNGTPRAIAHFQKAIAHLDKASKVFQEIHDLAIREGAPQTVLLEFVDLTLLFNKTHEAIESLVTELTNDRAYFTQIMTVKYSVVTLREFAFGLGFDWLEKRNSHKAHHKNISHLLKREAINVN